MKTICYTILGAMLAAGVSAQDTNTLPEIPAPVTSPAAEMPVTPPPASAPEAKPVEKKHVVRHARHVRKISEPTVSLPSGPAEVNATHVNVRGQAGLKGEHITQLSKGDTVNVLEQINLSKHAPNEPAQWAKISYPQKAHVWVSGKFIDSANKTVTARKLNLRAGPGENYSVVGTIEHGTPVNEIETKGNWIEIEPPANAYAFVAAMYLTPEAAPVPVPTPTPTPAPAETAPMPMPAPTPTPTPVPSQPTITIPPPVVPEPSYDASIPRIATHEGVVRHTSSPITPTTYELYSPETDRNIDYLYSTTSDLDLGRYVGMRIIVTGEESLAARWPTTPVLTVQRIEVIKTNAVPRKIYLSPRQQQERHH